jgi:hypothetical protein
MPITQSQRVAAGRWYVDEIKRRIAVRESAVEKTKGQAEAERSAALREYGEKAAKLHRLGSFASAGEYHTKNDATGNYEDHLVVKNTDGMSMFIPVRMMPGLAAALEKAGKPQRIARDCCTEVEFLTKQLGNRAIAGFQSYVSKLHAGPADPTDAALGKHLDNYLTALRPAVCKIA